MKCREHSVRGQPFTGTPIIHNRLTSRCGSLVALTRSLPRAASTKLLVARRRPVECKKQVVYGPVAQLHSTMPGD